MKGSLFKVKPVNKILSDVDNEKHGFKKALSSVNLVTLGIGAIIGAGIFVLTGQAAAQYAGPAIVISFVISGLACVLAGFCYAEFASMIPVSGSAYTYAYATLGEFLAWIIGWDLVLEYLFASSTVAVGWSGYVVSLLRDFDINIPVQLTAAFGTVLVDYPSVGWRIFTEQQSLQLAGSGFSIEALPHVTGIINLPAMLIVAVVTVLLVIGIKESAGFNNIMVFIKVAVILLFIAVGFYYVNKANWSPFIPDMIYDSEGNAHYGWWGILRAAGVIFFAYIGFDAVSTAAQEAKRPQKDMPKGILGSLGISTTLYILVAIVLTGIVSYTQLNVADPIAVGVNAMGTHMTWLRYIIKVAAIAGLSSVILVMLMGQPRVFYTMSKDGLLPGMFSKVHTKFRTPYISSIISGFVAMILAGFLPIDKLSELVSIGTLLAFAIVCISVIVLRKSRPDMERPFKTPWVPFIPILGAVVCLAQMIALPLATWYRLLIWMLIGIAIYFIYSRRHSKMNDYKE